MQVSNDAHEVISLAFDYVKGPVTARSQAVFSRLIAPISHGRVLDVGCGTNAYYWAFGYAQRVDSITFADVNEEFLQQLRAKLEGLTAVQCADMAFVLDYLRDAGLIDARTTQQAVCTEILRKAQFVPYDFLSDVGVDNQFDFILSLGSLGCVHSQEQLVCVLRRIADLLLPDGRLHAIWTPYKERDAFADRLIELGIDGTLNPNLANFEAALADSGLEVLTLEQRDASPDDGFYSNYLEPIFLVCRRP